MKRWHILIPLIAAAAAYAPAPWGQLVWDDQGVVDFQLRYFTTLRDVFVPPDDIVRWSYAYYRPMVVLSYLLDARLFGRGTPTGPHVVNLACHLVITGTVWLLARRLLRHLPHGETGALLTAVLFAVHPIHTESVSWIAGRSDLLATLFLLPALLLALRWRDTRSVPALLLAPVLYLLALLSKEVAITGLALLPLLLVLARRDALAVSGRSAGALASILACMAFAGVAVAYLWMRHMALTPDLEYQPFTWGERAWRSVQALAYYIVKAVLPWPQSAIITWDMVPGRLISAMVVLASLVLAAWSAWRWRRGDGTLLLAVGWFSAPVALAIWTSVGPVTNTPLAERHLYLPSVGLALAAGIAGSAAWASRWRRPAAMVAGLVLVAYGAAAVERGMVWRTDYTLWADTTAKARTDGIAWLNFGFSQWARGEADNAIASFQRALEDPALPPKFLARARNGIGIVLASRGNDARAEENFRQAIATDPEFVEPLYRVASLYIERAGRLGGEGRTAERNRAAEQAISNLATATARYPDYHEARLKLAAFLLAHGQAVEQDGDRSQALRRYRAALDQLDKLAKRVADDPRDGVLAKAIAEVRADPGELRRRLEANLARS